MGGIPRLIKNAFVSIEKRINDFKKIEVLVEVRGLNNELVGIERLELQMGQKLIEGFKNHQKFKVGQTNYGAMLQGYENEFIKLYEGKASFENELKYKNYKMEYFQDYRNGESGCGFEVYLLNGNKAHFITCNYGNLEYRPGLENIIVDLIFKKELKLIVKYTNYKEDVKNSYKIDSSLISIVKLPDVKLSYILNDKKFQTTINEQITTYLQNFGIKNNRGTFLPYNKNRFHLDKDTPELIFFNTIKNIKKYLYLLNVSIFPKILYSHPLSSPFKNNKNYIGPKKQNTSLEKSFINKTFQPKINYNKADYNKFEITSSTKNSTQSNLEFYTAISPFYNHKINSQQIIAKNLSFNNDKIEANNKTNTEDEFKLKNCELKSSIGQTYYINQNNLAVFKKQKLDFINNLENRKEIEIKEKKVPLKKTKKEFKSSQKTTRLSKKDSNKKIKNTSSILSEVNKNFLNLKIISLKKRKENKKITKTSKIERNRIKFFSNNYTTVVPIKYTLNYKKIGKTKIMSRFSNRKIYKQREVEIKNDTKGENRKRAKKSRRISTSKSNRKTNLSIWAVVG
ncbi:MAG: hypothetical protein QXH71_04350 [Candidatus Anstonellaceae archaeon]